MRAFLIALAATSMATPASAALVMSGAFPVGNTGSLFVGARWYQVARGSIVFEGATLTSVEMFSESEVRFQPHARGYGPIDLPVSGGCEAVQGASCNVAGPYYGGDLDVFENGLNFETPFRNTLAVFSGYPLHGDFQGLRGTWKWRGSGAGVGTTFTFHFAPVDGATEIRYRLEGVRQAIPEPTTWAMMILGFGAAGASLRRRTLPA